MRYVWQVRWDVKLATLRDCSILPVIPPHIQLLARCADQGRYQPRCGEVCVHDSKVQRGELRWMPSITQM